MSRIFNNITGRIKSTRFFKENSSAVDSILILLFISFFVVGVDLSKEMAQGEFTFFACILTETQSADNSAILDSLIVDPPLIGLIEQLFFIPPKSDVSELNRGRAPPELPSHI